MEQPDPRVLRKAQRGDAQAFTTLVRQYESRLFNFILRSVQVRTLAEDLMQDVLMRVHESLPRFRGGSFTTWLFEIAKNRVIDEHRSGRDRLRSTVPLELVATVGVETKIGVEEQLDAIWGVIAGLAWDIRVPLLLREIAGLSYTEIAETLGLPISTVRWRIFVARQELVQGLHDLEHPVAIDAMS
jgi:RNA polymerase sigma-70 factor (ECF subfamily)